MTDCTAPRHDGQDEPTPAAPHAHLCRGCTAGLRRDLRCLPGWWTAIEELLQPSGADGLGGGENSIGLPVNERAVEWRSQARWYLEQGTVWVASRSRHPVPADTRIPALAGWLCGQVRWIMYRPWAGDMAGAFDGLRRRKEAIINPKPPTAAVIPAAQNWCPACRETGLLLVVRRTAVTCTGCGHAWDSTQLLRLGRDILRVTEGKAA